MAIIGTKRKRISKKNKLAWRKHTKVDDIEEFLEEQREEERLGGQLDTISDEHLFVLDAKPKDAQISSKQTRKQRALRPLKGFLALQPHTNVPDPIKKRNRVQTSEERKSILVKQKALENRKKGVLKIKDINAIAERRLNEIKKERKEKRGEFTKDIWSGETDHEIQKDPWAEPITVVHTLRNTGVPVKRIAKDLQKKKSVLPAVEIPHPGMSYNPSFKDHQDLLRIVAEDEKKIIKKEEHLNRVTRDMFRKVSQNRKQDEWMVEMSEGIPSKSESKETEVKEESVDDLDHISVNPPVQNKKKTLKQRRKQKEQLQLKKELKAKKLQKKKIGDIHTIKKIQKGLELMEKTHVKLREIRKIRAEKEKLKPKQLSSNKFEDTGLDFQLGQDIAGNLRAVKKEGNLLNDRFKSLQKRNILEPSKKVHRKKPKVKKYTKPGHKEDWEKTVARSTNANFRKK